MADVILKNAIGEEVTYEGVKVVQLNTSDGQQAFTEGEPEEKTVDLDFFNGDMVITPSEGKALIQVDIPKPDTLIPENIAKDVNIAGILGIHEGGEQDPIPPVLFANSYFRMDYYNNNSTTSYDISDRVGFPSEEAKVVYAFGHVDTNYSSTATSLSITYSNGSLQYGTISVEKNGGYTYVYLNRTVSFNSSYRYKVLSRYLYAVAQMPGWKMKKNDSGYTLFCEDGANVSNFSCPPLYQEDITIIDLANSKLTSIGSNAYLLAQANKLQKVIYPLTTKTIYGNMFRFSADSSIVLDCTRLESVPSLSNGSYLKAASQILVPAALYSSWIAATNWSTHASKIIAV